MSRILVSLGSAGVWRKLKENNTLGAPVLAECAATAYPYGWVRAGPPAAAIREPRQARKGAAVVVMSGAGVRLVRAFQLGKTHKII